MCLWGDKPTKTPDTSLLLHLQREKKLASDFPSLTAASCRFSLVCLPVSSGHWVYPEESCLWHDPFKISKIICVFFFFQCWAANYLLMFGGLYFSDLVFAHHSTLLPCSSVNIHHNVPVSVVLCMFLLAFLAQQHVFGCNVFSQSELHRPTSLLLPAIAQKCRLEQALVTTCACPHTFSRDSRAQWFSWGWPIVRALIWCGGFFLMWWQMRALEVVSVGLEFSPQAQQRCTVDAVFSDICKAFQKMFSVETAMCFFCSHLDLHLIEKQTILLPRRPKADLCFSQTASGWRG